MYQHITFKGMESVPTDHENHEGSCATLVNLIAEGEALRPVAMDEHPLASVAADSRVRAVHATTGYRHIIVEHSDGEGGWVYEWWDASDGGAGIHGTETLIAGDALHPLATTAERVCDIASVGDTLTFVLPSGLLHCCWLAEDGTYLVAGHDDLLYDITLTQDLQRLHTVTLPVSASLARHLDAPGDLLSGCNALAGRMFDGFYDSADAYATGATLVAAHVEAAIERLASAEGLTRHVSLGIAALRLRDGSHLMPSNIFALLPAALSDTLHADRDTGLLTIPVWLHRHQVTVVLRHPAVARLIEGVDIFLTRPQSLLDLRQARRQTADEYGRTTSLTFGPMSRQSLVARLDHLDFYHAMTVSTSQLGMPLTLAEVSAAAPKADLSNFCRTDWGAAVAIAHHQRLTLGATTPVLHSPMEVGVRYRYATLTSATRPSAGSPDASVLESERVCGHRADLGDNEWGTTAQLVTHAYTSDSGVGEVWWLDEVQYPLPGMMMVPSRHVKEVEYHLRVTLDGTTRYFTTRQHLTTLDVKGMAVAVFPPSGGVHRPSGNALLSLLMQQVRALEYDGDSRTYVESYLTWEEETADAYAVHAARARQSWALSSERSALRTSSAGSPFVFPGQASAEVGGGTLLGLAVNTRRSADGLFGDGQFYAFSSDGLWLLRFSGGRWSAQQCVTRRPMLAGTRAVCTDDAVVFITSGGVMMVKGSKATCLSECVAHPLFTWRHLPHAADLPGIATLLPGVAGDNDALPGMNDDFLTGARLCYDRERQWLWLYHPQEGGHHWPLSLVYSLRSGTWALSTVVPTSVCDDGSRLWGTVAGSDGQCRLSLLAAPVRATVPVLLCTRPLSLGRRHVLKRVVRMMVRGLFVVKSTGTCGSSAGTCGSSAGGTTVGVALYGGNDLRHWQLVGTSASQYLCRYRGTPYKWFRVVVTGKLRAGDSLEGVSFEFKQWLFPSRE